MKTKAGILEKNQGFMIGVLIGNMLVIAVTGIFFNHNLSRQVLCLLEFDIGVTTTLFVQYLIN